MTTNHYFLLFMVCNFFLNVVIPNSFNAVAAVVLITSFGIAILQIEWTKPLKRLIFMFIASATVTLIYVAVGVTNGASLVAVNQITLTYIIFPLIWIVVSANLFQTVTVEQFKFWLIFFSFIGVASVGIFFYLFLRFGSEAVLVFINNPNINLKDGYAQATMHIYGSFIFLTGAFFAVPRLIANHMARYLLLCSFVVVAATSGRSALIISIFIGATIGIVFLPRSNSFSKSRSNNFVKFMQTSAAQIVALAAIGGFFTLITEIDLSVIIDNFTSKLVSGGGIERVEQADALITSIKNTFAMGVGHGVGLSYVRNEEYPWRYELVWLATLHRVGVFGFAIYALSFCACIFIFFKRWRQRILLEFDVFLFSGFICALVASGTNPYIEAFSFQWMYVIPIVYFLVFNNGISKHTNISILKT